MEEIEIDAEQILDNLKKLEQQLRDLNDLRSKLSTRLETIGKGVDQFKDISTEKDRQMRDINLRLRKTETTVSEIDIDDLLSRIQLLEDDVDDNREKYEEVRKADATLIRDVETLEKIFSQIGSIENLKDVQSDIKSGVREMKEMKEIIDKKYAEMEKDAHDLIGDVKNMSSTMKRLENLEKLNEESIRFLNKLALEFNQVEYRKDFEDFKEDLMDKLNDIENKLRKEKIYVKLKLKETKKRKRKIEGLRKKAIKTTIKKVAVKTKEKKITKKARRKTKSKKSLDEEYHRIEIPEPITIPETKT